MNEFLLLFRNTAGDGAYSVSPEEMQAAMPRWREWIGEIAAKGALVATQPLEYEGKTVHPDRIADGPYVEIKEIIVGYLCCRAENFDAALAMAQSCPILLYPGGSVEVRPVVQFQM